SMNGGQRLTVSCSRERMALNACGGMALNHAGTPTAAGTGGGSIPSNSLGQRNVSVIGFSGSDTTSVSPYSISNARCQAIICDRRLTRQLPQGGRLTHM